jgi:glycosyltransferase involved in cell wall biosynthesis
MAPFFSIIIPVFNQEEKLTRCIESLLGQTMPDYEAIIVDDGSTDGSMALLKKLLQGDERFHFVQHEKNESVHMARKTGLKRARGDYIVFADIDDYLDPDMLEVMKENLNENPVDVFMHNVITEPGDRILSSEISDDMLKGLLTIQVRSALYQLAVAKKVMERVTACIKDGYCNLAEDYYLSAIIHTFARSYAKIERPLYHYVFGEGMYSSVSGHSVSSLERQLGYLEFSMNSTREFLAEYSREHLEMADKLELILIQDLVYMYCRKEVSWRECFTYMNYFNQDKYEAVFEWITSDFLPKRAMELKQIHES